MLNQRQNPKQKTEVKKGEAIRRKCFKSGFASTRNGSNAGLRLGGGRVQKRGEVGGERGEVKNVMGQAA
jgi:hypothetical protein